MSSSSNYNNNSSTLNTTTTNVTEVKAPIVREQHVYTQSTAAPEVIEKHVVREQHLTQEQPIIEKKIIHERPIVQEKTIVHEKPIVHEKKIVEHQQKVVTEQPIIQHTTGEVVRENPTFIRDTTTQFNNNNVSLDEKNIKAEEKESKPGFFANLFGGKKTDDSNNQNDETLKEKELQEKKAAEAAAADATANNAGSGSMIKNLFSSNVPRPFATTTYDYGTAGSTTVAAAVPASDLNTAATLPNGPSDSAAGFGQTAPVQNKHISSA